jgi:hypothetical protein
MPTVGTAVVLIAISNDIDADEKVDECKAEVLLLLLVVLTVLLDGERVIILLLADELPELSSPNTARLLLLLKDLDGDEAGDELIEVDMTLPVETVALIILEDVISYNVVFDRVGVPEIEKEPADEAVPLGCITVLVLVLLSEYVLDVCTTVFPRLGVFSAATVLFDVSVRFSEDVALMERLNDI